MRESIIRINYASTHVNNAESYSLSLSSYMHACLHARTHAYTLVVNPKLESKDRKIARLENLLVEAASVMPQAARSASTRSASTTEGERPARTRDAELGKKEGDRFVL